MELITIPIEHLHSHPSNSNVMTEKSLKKLATHIEQTDRYPPVVARAMPTNGEYQILDGHHRVKALRMVGRSEARCVVWNVDDNEALILLGTLNRLSGNDDVHKHADLVAQLREKFDLGDLAKRLPEERARLEKILKVRQSPPAPRPPTPLEEMPVAVHFFLLPEQKNRLNACLKTIGGSKEEALMRLVEAKSI